MELNDIIADMGATGEEMTRMGAAEASAGNMSVFVRELSGLDERFKVKSTFKLPVKTPALAGGWVVVSGTGRRIRDVNAIPEKVLCVLNINPGGEDAVMYTGLDSMRPTIESGSHFSVHEYHVATRGLQYHAVLHVQPIYLTFLSHLENYSDTHFLNRRLMRWEPETVAMISEGVGMIPFSVMGTMEQALLTGEGLKDHHIVFWQRHGTVSRSDVSITKAADLVEYAEVAAHYEYLNLALGRTEGGMLDEQIKNICAQYNIQQKFF